MGTTVARKGRASKDRVREAAARGIEALEARILFNAIAWKATGSGDWNDASNWSGGVVPTINDDVTIAQPGNQPITVTVSNDAAAKSINMTGDSLDLNGGTLEVGSSASLDKASNLLVEGGTLSIDPGATFALLGNATYSSGMIGGPGANTGTLDVAAGATLTFKTGASGSLNIGVGTLTNQGTIIQTGGTINLTNQINWINNGTIDAQGDGSITTIYQSFSYQGFFTNNGTFLKSAGGGTETINMSMVNNNGTFEADSGTIDIGLGFTFSGGNFLTSAGTMVEFGNNYGYMQGTFTGSGAGTVALQSFVTLVGNTTFNFTGSTLQMSNAVRIGGDYVEEGPGYTLTNKGIVNIAPTFTANNVWLLGEGTFDNDGSVIDNAPGPIAVGSLGGYSGETGSTTTIVNESGGVFDFTSAYSGLAYLSIGGIGGSQYSPAQTDFQNYGTIEVTGASGGAGQVVFNFGTFEQYGALNIDAGTFDMTSNIIGFLNNSPSIPSFNIAAGATMNISSYIKWKGFFTATGGGHIIGDGTTVREFNDGSSAIWDFPVGMMILTNPTFELDNGTLFNLGDVTILSSDATDGNGNDYQSYGTFEGAGTLYNFGGGSITFAGDAGIFYASDDTNSDTPTSAGATIKNDTGATLNIADVSFLVDPSSSSTSFGSILNNGTFRKNAGTGTAEINADFTNNGTLESDSGTLQLDDSEAPVDGSTWSALGGSTISIANEDPSWFSNLTYNVILGGAGATIGDLANQISGVSTGSLTIKDGATLTTAGDLSVGTGGALTFEIDGSADSNDYGSIYVNGDLDIAGTLNFVIGNGFSVVPGDYYSTAYTTGSYTLDSQATVTTDPTIAYFSGSNSFGAYIESAPADLTPQVDGYVTSIAVGDQLNIDYEDDNVSTTQTNNNATWTDSFYLSASGQLDSSAILLGTQTYSNQTIYGDGSIESSFSATIPPVVPGTYKLIIVTDSGDQLPDANRANNTLVFNQPITVTMPTLSLGQTFTTGIEAGQDYYYVLSNPTQADELVTAAAASGTVSIYIRKNAVPTTTIYDQSSTGQAGSTVSVPVLSPGSGQYVVLIHGNASAGSGGVALTISTRQIGFEISSLSSSTFADNAAATITIHGYHFTANTTAKLTHGGATLNPVSVTYVNSTTIQATFDFSNATPEGYDLTLTDQGKTATQTGAVTVVPYVNIVGDSISTATEWLTGQTYLISGTTYMSGTLTIDPGAIVKFAEGASLYVSGTLIANGTVAQPIIFTSYRDDANGGDTNNDGNGTSPASSDWAGITIAGGTSTFNHTQVLYAASAFTQLNGTLNFNNGLIDQAYGDGIYMTGGNATFVSTVFSNNDRAIEGHGGTVTAVNCTIYGSRFGVRGAGLAINLVNSIVAESSSYGVYNNGGESVINVSYSDVYSDVAGSVNYFGLADQTGSNGNISANPNFVSPTAGNFQLQGSSLAIDAADATQAPITDALGDARYSDPRVTNKTGVPDSSVYADMGAYEYVTGAPSNVDLVVTNVTGPTSITAGQSAVISWTVQNVGTGSLSGSWHDTIELVNPSAAGGAVVLEARTVISSATLGANGSATFTASVTIPFGTEGNYHWQVHTNSAGDIYEGTNAGNNTALQSAVTKLSDPTITPGNDATGAFTTVGQGVVYKINTAAGQSVLLSLLRSDTGVTDLYIGQGSAPTQTSFTQHVTAYNSATAAIQITDATAGTYYVLIVPRSLPTGSSTYTLSASIPAALSLTSTGIKVGGIGSSVTISLVGTNFASGMTAQLIGPNGATSTLTASSVTVTDSAHAYATFDLSTAQAGAYDVQVAEGATTAKLSAAFTVQAATMDGLQVTLIEPTVVRVGRLFTAYLIYRNTGNTNVGAPIVTLTTPDGNGVALDPTDTLAQSIQLFAQAQDGPAGTLLPGSSYSVPIYILGQAGLTNDVDIDIDQPTTDSFNRAALQAAIEPAGAGSGWLTAFDTLFSANGTNADYLAALAKAATYEAVHRGTIEYTATTLLTNYLADQANLLQASLVATYYLDNSTTPLANATVIATNTSTGASYTSVTDAVGQAAFQTLPSGTYTLSALDYITPSGQAAVTVTSGTTAATANWIVQEAGQIEGRIVVPPSVDPTTEDVIATDSDGNIVDSTSLRATGGFNINGLATGTYTLHFSGNGSIAQPADMTVDVTQGAITTLDDVTASLAGNIAGTIADSTTNASVTDGVVSLLDASNNVVAQASITDAGGFTFGSVAAGPYTIRIDATGYLESTSATIVVTAGQQTTAALKATAGATVQGTITLGGQGVAGATVEVVDASDSNNVYGTSPTDASGNYVIYGLAANTYNLLVTDQAVAADATVSVSLGVGQTVTKNVSLDAGASVKGAVTIAGQAIGGVGIRLIDSTGAIVRTATSASDGSYSFGGLTAGTYTVALPDGSNRQQITLASSTASATANIALNVGGVDGYVIGADGSTPESGTDVVLMQNGQVVQIQQTYSDGSYFFPLVAPGTYQVSADNDTETFSTQTVVVTAAQATQAATIQPDTSTLNIVVTDGVHSSATATGTVQLIPLVLPDGTPLTMAATLSNGQVTFGHLTPGNYIVLTTLTNGEVNLTPITVNGGSNAQSVTTSLPGSVSGSVTDSSGNALAGLLVTIYQPGAPGLQFAATTDANGNFSVQGLAAGVYRAVIADASNNAYASATVDTIYVGYGGNTSVPTVAMAAPSVTVTGTVTDGAKNIPLGGAIDALNADGVIVASAAVDANGHFTFKTLTTGTYTLRGDIDGYSVADQSLTIAGGQTTAAVTMSATWSADPNLFSDTLGSIVGAVKAQGQLLATQTILAIKELIQGPQKAPPLGPLADLPCPCSYADLAISWYSQAQYFNQLSIDNFDNSLDPAHDALLQIFNADEGLVAISMAQLAISILALPASIAATSAVAVFKGANATVSATLANPVSTQVGLNLVRDFLQSGPIRGLVGFGVAGVYGNSVSASANGTSQNLLGQFLSDLGGLISSPSIAALTTVSGDLGSLLGEVSSVLGLIQVITSTPGVSSAAASALGIVGSLVSVIATSAQSVQDAIGGVLDYQNKIAFYKNIVKRRDEAKNYSDQAAAQALQYCNDVPVTPATIPDPPKKHSHDPGPPGVDGVDPNDKFTTGYGTLGYIQPNQIINYTVEFENQASATAPAQEVVVKDQISSNVDWSTFQLQSINFNNVTIAVPPGLQHYATTTTVSTDPNPVSVTADFDPTTGLLTLDIKSYDANTEQFPTDPLAGFLPPNDANGDGEGYITFSVAPLAGLSDGSTINNQASVVFDTNAAILTPTVVNTIDGTPPASSVSALPPTTNTASFTVNWTGSDAGSGIAAYDVYVSDNGGAYTLFTQTSDTSATFDGADGHTYSFLSVATDNAGNAQAFDASSAVSTTVNVSGGDTDQADAHG